MWRVMPWQMQKQCIMLKSQVKRNELNSTPRGLKSPFKIPIIFFTARNFIDFSKNRKSISFIDTANKRAKRISIMVKIESASESVKSFGERKVFGQDRNVVRGSQHWYISIKLKKKNNNKHQKCDDLTTPLQRTHTFPLYYALHYYICMGKRMKAALS